MGSTATRKRPGMIVSSAVLLVILLVLGGFAVAYQGESRTDVEVQDGMVWVQNRDLGLAGQVNVKPAELANKLAVRGDGVDIIQSGYHVYSTDSRGFSPIDPASSTLKPRRDVGPDSRVTIGGDRLAIADGEGHVWVLTPDQAEEFNPQSVKPVHTAKGGRPQVAVGTDGTVYVLDGSSLLEFPRSETAAPPTARKPFEVEGLDSSRSEDVQLSVVGERPVIFDPSSRSVIVAEKGGRTHTLDQGAVGDLAGAQLQQPSAQNDSVMLSTANGAWVLPLDSGEAREIPGRGAGRPVPPAYVAGCYYAAWNVANTYLRECGGEGPGPTPIPESRPDADLRLRVNGDLVVLNDVEFGSSWMISSSMALVEQWKVMQEIRIDERKKEQQDKTVTTRITNIVTDRNRENRPPTAAPDEFGVRPGGHVVLPVLRNDTDPDGDVLTASVVGDQPGIGRVTPIRGGTQLQVQVDPQAQGSATFTYRAADGRGGASEAQVTLTVVPPEENTEPAPVKDAVLKLKIRGGESASLNVLPYWQDPDGDAISLHQATIAPEDQVTFRPDGHLTVHDAGLKTGTKRIDLQVRDEKGLVGAGVLEVEVVDDADLPPVTTADHLEVVAGRSATIRPLVNDMNPGGGDLDLAAVGETSGLEVDADLTSGAVTVRGESPGTFYLDYSAVSGAASAKGLIRVDVVEPTREALEPVPVADQAVLTIGGRTLVDPLENDVDPTGGVLVVGSIEVPPNRGISAHVLNHGLVRFEAEPGAQPGQEPVPVTYTVANSSGTSTGTILVMVVPQETQFANPVTVPDRGVVREADVAVMDVLANDTSPTGSEMHVTDVALDAEAEDKGILELVDDHVRFIAHDGSAGDVAFTYTVTDETGRQSASRGTVRIISADDPNDPPSPENVVARTESGGTVQIPISTQSIDPDGDTTLLMGLASPAPRLGKVISARGGVITYQAFDDAVGTDRFQYQVMDRNGGVATGEVQVGIARPSGLNQPPLTIDDHVQVRPGREVQARVLDNDSDPESAPLAIVHSETESMNDALTVREPASETSATVDLIAPTEPGSYAVAHTVSDGQLSSPSVLTVTVDPKAPRRAPIARDDFVDPAAVLDPEGSGMVRVAAKDNDSDPDGSVENLQMDLVDAPEGARIVDAATGTVEVPVADDLQRIRYRVTDEDEQSVYGFIWVPGQAKQAPQWVGGTITTKAGSAVDIDLRSEKSVRVRPGGRPVSIVDPDSISAAHHDGSPLATDVGSLRYNPAAGFAGEDTITVEVTDGQNPGDPAGAVSTLQIPVRVTATEQINRPPTLQGAVLSVEQGGNASTVDLARGAKDPDGDQLRFALGDVAAPKGVTIGLDGTTLYAQAAQSVPKGTTVQVPVSVTDGKSDSVGAQVQLTVTGSREPLIQTVRDDVQIDAGTSQTVPVLANDANPFPDAPTLKGAVVTAGRGTIEVRGDSVVLTPAEDFHGILSAQYTVLDATGDPERQVSGEIRATVRARPEPPSAPRVREIGDGRVVLEFSAGADNGAPITGYTVRAVSGGDVTQECASTTCTVTGLTNGTTYTFQATATNAVGTSDPSATSAQARPDVKPEVPAAPRVTRGDGELEVSWQEPQNNGSPIVGYDLRILDAETGGTRTQQFGPDARSMTWPGLVNGRNYTFQVQARNGAEEPSGFSASSTPEHPAGPPGALEGKVTATHVQDAIGGSIDVSWPAMTSTGETNGEPITEYIVRASDGSTQRVPASRTSVSFRDLDPDTTYTFTVTGVNSVGTGQTPSAPSNGVRPIGIPNSPGNVSASLGDPGSREATVSWSAPEARGGRIESYLVQWNGGSREVKAGSTSTTINGLTDGTSYRFTVIAKNAENSSEPSAPSAAVMPFSAPDAPTVSLSPQKCTSRTSCTVDLSVRANGDGANGQLGVKSLQVQVNNGSTTTISGTQHSQTLTVASGEKVTVTARATNTKGATSSATTKSATAQTYIPPTPVLVGDGPDWRGYGSARYETLCKGGKDNPDSPCNYFTVTIGNLEPNSSVVVEYHNWARPEPSNWKHMELTADSQGRVTTDLAFYGFTKELPGENGPFTVTVNKQRVGGEYYAPSQ
ncbi:fibronectin type III domain-containing protein [Brachybacterium sp. EF45031]|uniref:Ig-like domain-containing protein n=1 Tax=Brachybacterium sillae TaxID=2810536 RepID=UPI00217D4DEF|nr:Ig-like domain-containing protein [Brachybacterium sillae]MCS6711096.1 fibronectin type III domain-containing protein [Brachybacterium sillae]